MNLDDYITVASENFINGFSYKIKKTGSNVDYAIQSGSEFKIRGSRKFKILNAWYIGSEYLYLHLEVEDSKGQIMREFEAISIYKPFDPFLVLEDSIQSVYAR